MNLSRLLREMRRVNPVSVKPGGKPWKRKSRRSSQQKVMPVAGRIEEHHNGTGMSPVPTESSESDVHHGWVALPCPQKLVCQTGRNCFCW